jgi:signal recognition particle subunit SEC65
MIGAVSSLVLDVEAQRDSGNPKSLEACAAVVAQEYGVSARELLAAYDSYLRGELDGD